MLDFDDEDDEGGRREFDGIEELERAEEDGEEEDEDEVRPGCRGRPRNRFIDDEAGVWKMGREEDD